MDCVWLSVDDVGFAKMNNTTTTVSNATKMIHDDTKHQILYLGGTPVHVCVGLCLIDRERERDYECTCMQHVYNITGES